MKRLFKCFSTIIISFLCTLIFGLSAYATDSLSTDEDNNNVVRVGYFYAKGYHEIDESGSYFGYGYELFEKIRSFTGINFEYVGYDKSWNEMFTMLDNGEIDLLSNVNWSEERDEKYLFSDYDVGISAFSLSCLKTNNKYDSKRLNLNGARIGFMLGDSSFNVINNYALENEINYHVSFYNTDSDMFASLESGAIDLVGITNFSKSDSLKTVMEFGEDYLYIVTTKDKSKLMHDINRGLESLYAINPGVISELSDKYQFVSSTQDSLFTREEREYIESRKNKPIKCLCITGMNPVAYINNNEVVGILPDYLRLVSERTGLSFEIYGITNQYDLANASKEIGAEIRLDSLYDFNNTRYYNSILSSPYLTLGAAKVYAPDSVSNGNIGIIHSPDPFTPKNVWDKAYNVIEYYGLYEATVALHNSSIDYLVVPSYVAQYICSEYSEYGFKYSLLDNSELDICYEIYDDNYLLTRILSNAISGITTNELQEIIASNLSYNEKGFRSFSDLFDMYSWLPFAIWLAGLSIIAIVIILLYKAYTSKREHALALENLSYFKSILGANLFAVKAEVSPEDVDFTIYYFNDKDSFGTGITEHLLTSDDVLSYRNKIHPEDLAAFDEFISIKTLKRLSTENMPAYSEIRALDSSGRYIYVSLSAHSMPAFNENDNILIVIKNIDLSKKEEEEKRKTILLALETAKRYSDSKTRFLSQMSHDIRTPLNAIVGMSTIAKMNIENKKKVEECLDIIDDSSDHLLALVSDILDMTKIESGKLSFSNKRISLPDILQKSTNMFNSKVKSANIDFSVDYSSIRHTKVVTDPTRLEQVFTNIISNATKYTPPGGKVSVRLEEIEPKDDGFSRYLFSVKDTGIGMDEGTLERLFNPFERAESVEYMEGAGLGMAITKNIIDALGGEITVSSHPGLGTEVNVKFTFPDDVKSSLSEIKDLHDTSALIITGDKMLRDLLTAIFEEGHMIVDAFEDFSPICESVLSSDVTKYSVVAVSLDQPISDESLLLKRIRKDVGEDTIIIDITSEDYSVLSDMSEDNIVDGFMTLPCYKNNVIRIISDAMDKRRSARKTSMKVTCKGKHALIVEDVDINAIFAQAITEMKGFDSDIAENGMKAVELLEGSEDGYYSIVLMDIQMPIMNGYEATKVIRASNRPYLKHIPIIAMSANTFEEDVLKCKQVGMNDHIAKPVDVNRFSELVDLYVKD